MARKNVEAIQIHVPPGTRERIREYAVKIRRYAVMSDYIRSLIEADMRAHGEHIDLTVERGKAPQDEPE